MISVFQRANPLNLEDSPRGWELLHPCEPGWEQQPGLPCYIGHGGGNGQLTEIWIDLLDEQLG
jgi:hypothetical protein